MAYITDEMSVRDMELAMKKTSMVIIPVGVMGMPELAAKELGEKVCNEMINGLVEYVNMLEARAI